ncbi:MAG TPA: lamin tail domain-containing protein [Tenuifilaceae bacterium]|nr:lamin tail domain-containing protein [Tenuifilaceae bacterium]
MMKTKGFIAILSMAGIVMTSCVKDDIYVDNSGPSSDVKLVINEVASNMGDPNPDWMEIYNPSDAEIDMSGFGVYDKPDAIYKFAEGTKIAAKGYIVIICDKTLAASDPATYANFGISSSGETVYLVDAEEAIIDQVDVPAMDVGVSYARIPDGEDTFENANPTPGEPNSNTNEAPVIEADTIVTGMVNDNVRFQYDVVVKDASGVADVKMWMQTPSETYYFTMAPLGGGTYRVLLPYLDKGDEIQYYLEATDETGLKTTFKPEDDDAFKFSVEDGLAIFNSVEFSNTNPSPYEDITVTVDAYDKSGVAAVRLYYLVNDEDANNKVDIDLTFDGTVWTGTIPGQADESVIRYYLRATDNSSVKSYYPVEEVDGSFDHDDATTWPQITVAPLVILNHLVINEIEGGGSPDYIELYNGTSADIDISGYKLYDSGGLTDAYTIPNGTTITAGGFYVLDCDGSATTLFKISSGGEDITLEDASGTVVDQLLEGDWPGTPLVARKKDGAQLWVVPSGETKGTTNNI